MKNRRQMYDRSQLVTVKMQVTMSGSGTWAIPPLASMMLIHTKYEITNPEAMLAVDSMLDSNFDCFISFRHVLPGQCGNSERLRYTTHGRDGEAQTRRLGTHRPSTQRGA